MKVDLFLCYTYLRTSNRGVEGKGRGGGKARNPWRSFPKTMMIPMYLSVLTFYSYCLLESVTLVMLGNGKKTCPRIDIRQSSHVHYIIAWSFFHFLLLSLFFHFIRYFISWMIITINVIVLYTRNFKYKYKLVHPEHFTRGSIL